MGFGGWGLGFGVWDVGCRVQGVGFGVWGSGFRVWGLGCGVWGCTSVLFFHESVLVSARVLTFRRHLGFLGQPSKHHGTP